MVRINEYLLLYLNGSCIGLSGSHIRTNLVNDTDLFSFLIGVDMADMRLVFLEFSVFLLILMLDGLSRVW